MRSPRAERSIAALIVTVFCISAVAAEIEPPRSPQEVLETAFTRQPSLPYSGKKVLWWRGADDKRNEVTCRVWVTADGMEKEVYEKADGSVRRIVIRGAGKLRLWSDGQNSWRERPATTDTRSRWDHISLIGGNYDLSRSDVYYLERRCVAVHAKPVRDGRPELKAIVDAEAMVALAVEVSKPGGKDSYGYRFEAIGFDAVDPEVFKIPDDCELDAPDDLSRVEEFPTLREAAGKAGFELMEPGRLPAGFVEVGCSLGPHPWLDKEGRGLTARFSDGLGVVSMYERPSNGKGLTGDGGRKFTEVKREDRSVFWAQIGRNFILTTESGGIQATILGDVPLEELLEMAFSLAPAK